MAMEKTVLKMPSETMPSNKNKRVRLHIHDDASSFGQRRRHRPLAPRGKSQAVRNRHWEVDNKAVPNPSK